MTDTSIEWTDKTWNPVTGCTKVSPGCAHCYAEGVADRFWKTQCSPVVDSSTGKLRERVFTDVQCYPTRLDQPLRWKKPARIFVNSMSDLFHEDVPDAFIDQVFAVMALSPRHTFQVLTKRAERMRQYFDELDFEPERYEDAAAQIVGSQRAMEAIDIQRWPLPNLWLGVSVENQHYADERIPLLLQTPAAVRFISAEPLLGPIDFSMSPSGQVLEACDECAHRRPNPECDACLDAPPALDWVIVGGESGAQARPFTVAWARSIVQQCRAAGVPVFVKQLGANIITRNDDGWEGDTPKSWPMDTAYDEDLTGYRDGYQGATVRVRLVSKKGGDPSEWPEDLRVREFPL